MHVRARCIHILRQKQETGSGPDGTAGNGAHVANCGYVTATSARGQGVAQALCEHSQAEARRRGFTAMQFNFVVSTNTAAVRLWQKLGYDIAGTLPGAFRHPVHGPVDVHVMFKSLV